MQLYLMREGWDEDTFDLSFYYINNNKLYCLRKTGSKYPYTYLYSFFLYNDRIPEIINIPKDVHPDDLFMQLDEQEFLFKYPDFSLTNINPYNYYLQYLRDQNLDIILNGKG